MPNYRYQQGDQPLDGYTIQYALGRGGFGEVYFGISNAGRQVALKAVQNYEDVELRGISHCMNLKSPHLVTIFDVRRGQGGVPWVIMEYVSGPSLHEILNEAGDAGIGKDQAMFFTRELIKGLRYLHDAGVVHRDLKPHNVFFEDGTVKIGDYSLSKAISETQQTSHTTTVGSVHYMAPEIGEGKYDKVVDIYALGVILFEMLTGEPPYVGQSMGEVLIKHLTSEPDVSKLSQPFADVILTAMQRDPDKRFQSVDEMLLALCPTEHSSYLPPPTSLTMIGERAAKKRVSQNHVPPREHSAVPSHSLSDTFLPIAELVDTKETQPSSDSVPFSRPGIPKSSLSGLSLFGLFWQPTGKPMTGHDALSLTLRVVVAVLATTALLLMVALCTGCRPLEVISIVPIIVVLAGVITWALLQFSPRSPKLRWTIVSRWISTALCCISLFISIPILRANGFFKPSLYYGVLLFCILTVFVDWRCFISADRYPRVGILRTSAVASLFTLAFLGNSYDGYWVLNFTSLVALVISIQLLAPHHQEITARSITSKKSKATHGPNNQDLMDLELDNTQLDEFKIQVAQNKGQ